MKLVGFIKEHNNLNIAVSLDELLKGKSLKVNEVDKIITYLSKGVLLLGWMGYFIDEKTKTLIAPDSYFTDGVWVWPSYFTYYLGKYPEMKIDEEFLIFLKSKNFEFSVNDNFNLEKGEKELSEILSNKV
jgi:hypothetical protein